MARGFNEVDPIMEPAYQEEMQFRALCDTLPEFNLNLTLREIHTLMHFLELGMEGDDVDKFESTFDEFVSDPEFFEDLMSSEKVETF